MANIMATIPSLPKLDGPRSDGPGPVGTHPDAPDTTAAGARPQLPSRYSVPPGILGLGLAGTVLVALGGLGARNILSDDPILADSSLSWLTYGHGRMLAHAVLYLGIGLLTWAWIRLGRAARAGAISGRAVMVATGVWMLPLLVCPPLFSNDVYSYLAQGDLPVHGMNPYHHGVAELPSVFDDNVTPVWQHTPAPYGPFFILLAEGVAKIIGYHQVVAVLVMRWLIVLPGMTLAAWALPRLAAHYGGNTRLALWLGLANPLTLIYLVGGPHNDLLMAGMLAAGAVLVLQRHPMLGFVLVSLAAAIKAPAALALPFLVWVWAARLPGSPQVRFGKACAGAIAAFVAVFAATTATAQVDLGWIPALRANNVVVNWMSLPTGIGELIYLPFGAPFGVDRMLFVNVIRDVGLLAAAVVAVRQWWLARDGGPDAVRRAGVALFVAVLLSPTVFPWYFFWPLLLCAGLTWSGTGLVICTFGILWSMLSTFPSGDTALNSPGYQVATIVFAAVAAVSLVRFDPLGLAPGYRPTEFGIPRGRRSARAA